MSLADLTLHDVQMLRKVAPLVRLTAAERDAFTRGLTSLVSSMVGIGTPPAREALLAPLERTRETLVRNFGENYTADLIARLRR